MEQTVGQSDHCNPRCACAPRVNELGMKSIEHTNKKCRSDNLQVDIDPHIFHKVSDYLKTWFDSVLLLISICTSFNDSSLILVLHLWEQILTHNLGTIHLHSTLDMYTAR